MTSARKILASSDPDKDKMAKGSNKAGGSKRGQKRAPSEVTDPSDPLLADPRFNSASWEPRFSRVPKRAKQAIADDRFQTKLKEDPGFREKFTPVDRFGRPKKGPKLHNSIRQLAADDDDSSNDEQSDSDQDGKPREMMATQLADEDDSESEESDFEDFVDDGEEQLEHIPRGNSTKRLAVIGLDWSVTRSVDIFASLGCFCPTGKRIDFVEVHPSKFGLERLVVEAKMGPQVVAKEDLEVVRKANTNSGKSTPQKHNDIMSDDDEKEDEDDDEDGSSSGSDEEEQEQVRWKEQSVLRQYEEERLRYYYAVVQFEDVKAADAVYEQCDGVEYAQSGRSFDLRFIPNDMAIKTTPRDRANRVPDGYAPPNVNLSSLNNSTVKLSWDADDPDRVILKKKAFGKHELDEANLKAYLASSSDEEEKDKQSETEIERKRKLLLGATENEEEVGSEDVDLQVTFEPGMLEKGEEIIRRKQEKEQQAEETEWEGRLRRIRERKSEKRKQRREMFAAKDKDDGSSEEEEEDVEVDENPTFSDPFFTEDRNLEEAEEADRTGKVSKKQKGRRGKRDGDGDEQVDVEEEAMRQRRQAELELVTMADGKTRRGGIADVRMRLADADSDDEDGRHGRRNSKRTRGKRRSQKEKDAKKDGKNGSENVVDSGDARFQGVFESHLFAIDPTHPKFRDNETTKKIITEKGRRARDRPSGMETIGVAALNGSGRGSGTGGEGDAGKANAQAELQQLAARAKARRNNKVKEAKLREAKSNGKQGKAKGLGKKKA